MARKKYTDGSYDWYCQHCMTMYRIGGSGVKDLNARRRHCTMCPDCMEEWELTNKQLGACFCELCAISPNVGNRVTIEKLISDMWDDDAFEEYLEQKRAAMIDKYHSTTLNLAKFGLASGDCEEASDYFKNKYLEEDDDDEYEEEEEKSGLLGWLFGR